ncbi:MAG: putative phage protein [Streptosporangiaceae bacterium]|nr:putative phage protein [Streptosporangiaceae bacterium]
MAPPPLVTQADLEASLHRTVDPAQAALAIRRASARVRKYCRQMITFVADDTVMLPGNSRVLRLPQTKILVDATHPLTVVELFGVSNVEYNAVEGRDFTRIGSELTRGEAWWAPTRLMGWPWMRPQGIWSQRVRVTYSHGYTEIPDDIVDIVLDLATLNMINPGGLRSETIDDYSRTFAAETIGGAQLSKDHKDALRPYRVSAFSVTPVT